MLRNRAETALINSRRRRWLQRSVEARILQQLGGRMAGGTALEIGSGPGTASSWSSTGSAPTGSSSSNFDERMVARARHPVADSGDPVALRIGDAEDTGLADASVDAVFDFAIIHHTRLARRRRRGRPCVAAGRAVLLRGVTATGSRPTYRTFFDHPGDDRFTADEFVADLDAIALRVGERHRTYVGEDYVGVAERIG